MPLVRGSTRSVRSRTTRPTLGTKRHPFPPHIIRPRTAPITDTALVWDPLRAWRQAWANITAQHGSDTVADIIVCGDSITQGYFATDAENRWVDRLSAKLSEAAGHAAPTGYISANSLYCSYGSKKWTVTAGSVTDRQDLGLAYAAATLTSGSTIEYECDCDRIWVFYPTYSVLVGSIAISIDGGAPTVIAQFKPSTATRGGNVWDSGALASGSHTIEISQSGGFSGVVEGAYFFNGNHDRGVRVWQGGHFGYQASHYASRGV